MEKRTLATKDMTRLGLLIAVMIVLTRLIAFETTFLRISLTFIPEAITGMFFGPFWSGLALVVADLGGMLLFSKAPFFIGFTINAFLQGFIYGWFYYKKEMTWTRIILANVLVAVLVHMFLTPLWLGILYGADLTTIGWWIPRIIKNVLFLPIQIVTTYYMVHRIHLRKLLIR